MQERHNQVRFAPLRADRTIKTGGQSMKKALSITAGILLLGALFASGCGKGAMYAEFEQVLADELAAQERYMEAIANVVTAQDLARAIDSLAGQVEDIAPRLAALYEKYPSLRSKDKKMPPSIEALQKKIEANAAHMGRTGEAVNAKLRTMLNDPAVKKAFERLNEAYMLL